jgi:chromosome segregation ATPase
VDKKVMEEYEKKHKILKLNKDATENSLKDVMNQNATLRTKIDKLNELIIGLKQEKEESLKTYLELANQTYDQNLTQDTAIVEKYEKEKNDLRKQIDEQYTIITDLTVEASEIKEKNTQLVKKCSETWSGQHEWNNSPKSLMSG